jgi:hypothetical protein
MLLGRLTSPSDAAIRAEQVLRVQEALNALDPLDREVIALRQFEELSRAETAQVLGERVTNHILLGLVACPGDKALSPGVGYEHPTRQAERPPQRTILAPYPH